MKQVFHWFNFAFCLLLAGLGVLMIVFRGEALEKPTSIFIIMGGVQITLAFVMFLIGALLPKDGAYVTGKAKVIMKIILVLAAPGNNSPGSLAAYDLADGKVKVQRFWEPALPLTWLFTEAAFLAFFPSSGILAAAVFGSGAVLVLLFAGSLGWKILELKEKHIMDGVVALVRADLDEDMYYRWVIGDDSMCSMVLWSDADDKVYVYQFEGFMITSRHFLQML